jgi:hypothetical protein
VTSAGVVSATSSTVTPPSPVTTRQRSPSRRTLSTGVDSATRPAWRSVGAGVTAVGTRSVAYSTSENRSGRSSGSPPESTNTGDRSNAAI